MEKAKISRELAQSIEYGRSKNMSNREIIEFSLGVSDGGVDQKKTIRVDFDEFLKALVNGYEVVQTPEEKLKEAYDKILEYAFSPRSQDYYHGTRVGIKVALDALGIKIKGVND